MALPFPDDAFDAAVMPLVIFFVPEPATGRCRNGARGRSRRPGHGLRLGHGGRWVSPTKRSKRNAWHGRGCPGAVSNDASRIDALRELWTDAGLLA